MCISGHALFFANPVWGKLSLGSWLVLRAGLRACGPQVTESRRGAMWGHQQALPFALSVPASLPAIPCVRCVSCYPCLCLLADDWERAEVRSDNGHRTTTQDSHVFRVAIARAPVCAWTNPLALWPTPTRAGLLARYTSRNPCGLVTAKACQHGRENQE